MDKYDKLGELKKMFDKGLLEKGEFNNLKNQILFSDNVDNENDSELSQKYVSDFQDKSEKTKKTSTGATIVYIIIGIILFAFVKKTFFKTSVDEIIPITTEVNGQPKEINSNDYTNEYSNGLHDNGNQNNSSYRNNNSYQNNGGYHMGNDGRVYENNFCSLCMGTGIETGRNIATGELEGRICPMCDGRGIRSY